VGLKHVKCAEDDDFMAAFDKMMSDTLQVGSCCCALSFEYPPPYGVVASLCVKMCTCHMYFIINLVS